MNSIRAIAALTLTLAAISSFAGNVSSIPPAGQALTRAEVLAELVRARQAGEIGTYGDSDSSFRLSAGQGQPSSLTRAQVVAELQRARSNGELAITSELYGANLTVGSGSLRTRAEVLAEVKTGGLSRGGNQAAVLGN